MKALRARFAGHAAPTRVRKALRGGGAGRRRGRAARAAPRRLRAGRRLPEGGVRFPERRGDLLRSATAWRATETCLRPRRPRARLPEFATGPEGIFLKKGRTRWIEGRAGSLDRPRVRARHARRSPVLRQVVRLSAGGGAVRLALFGTGGFLVLHAVLLSLSLLAAYWFLRARSEPTAALAYAAVFFVASAAPVYFVWITAGDLQPVDERARLFCGLYADGQPRGAARQLVEPVPARRRRAVPRRGDHRRRRLLQADQRGAGGPDRRRRAAATRLAHGRGRQPRVRLELRRFLRAEPGDQRRGQLPGRRARLLRGQGLPVHDRGGADDSPPAPDRADEGRRRRRPDAGRRRAPGDRPLAQQPGRGVPRKTSSTSSSADTAGSSVFFRACSASSCSSCGATGPGSSGSRWAPASSPTWCCCWRSHAPTRAAADRSGIATSWGSTRSCSSSRPRSAARCRRS